MKGSKFCLSLAFSISFGLPVISLAQSPPIPYITATTLRSGSVITNSNSTRSFGFNIDSSRTFRATEGIAAVRIQLRTLSRMTSPYEVQCFFCAKDPKKARYVYDTVKVSSRQQFDDIIIAARDLFAGSKTVDTTTIRTTGTGTSSTGESVTTTATTNLISKTIVPGSSLEGWIVRVISRDRVVRLEASLQELKSFAERENASLNAIAAEVVETN